ncbi:hypothetical protein B0G81_2309 [Paraburkholderia sp. BL6665CI2N2]|nr:hypothetical protein B0G81_2309 [Paraburkholderia sp. BL6665CI2N2]
MALFYSRVVLPVDQLKLQRLLVTWLTEYSACEVNNAISLEWGAGKMLVTCVVVPFNVHVVTESRPSSNCHLEFDNIPGLRADRAAPPFREGWCDCLWRACPDTRLVGKVRGQNFEMKLELTLEDQKSKQPNARLMRGPQRAVIFGIPCS